MFGNAQRTGRGAGGQNTLQVPQPDLAPRVLGHQLRPAQGQLGPILTTQVGLQPIKPFPGLSAADPAHRELKHGLCLEVPPQPSLVTHVRGASAAPWPRAEAHPSCGTGPQ